MLVVTLTSWTARINNVKEILQALMTQTRLPDKIFLNLSKEEFNQIKLPRDLTDYISKNTRIVLNWVEGPNTKAFKKMFPILQYLKDEDIVIDFDDDIIPNKFFIESRVRDFNKYNTCISGSQNIINGYADGLLPEMKHWIGAGSLFQKKMLRHWEELLCEEIINTNHDDAFYDFLVYLNGYLPESCSEYPTQKFEHCKSITPALHGSIGCYSAFDATKINMKKFSERYSDFPTYNYFQTNPKAKKHSLKFVLADRVTKGGDNAEYLYRWLRDNRPDIDLTYILDKSSYDWKRLKNDGFNLIDGQNLLAVQSALDKSDSLLFSYFLSNTLPRVNTDSIHRVFLNHGVFFRLLQYLNKKEDQLDLMLVGNSLEYKSLLENYHFKESKLALTGQPRHDSLINNYNTFNKDNETNILIQFWWRPWFSSSESDFKKSTFYKNVYSLLSDYRLKALSEKYGVKFILKMHCMMEKFSNCFSGLKYVDLIPDEELFEPLFLSSKMIITDFTSNVYEMATIGKPCLYFRPDLPEFKKNILKRNDQFFDVKYEGIGPCTDSLDEFFRELSNMLESNFSLDEKYLKRKKAQLPFILDANCCQRAFIAIINSLIDKKIDFTNNHRVTINKNKTLNIKQYLDTISAITEKSNPFESNNKNNTIDEGVDTLDNWI